MEYVLDLRRLRFTGCRRTSEARPWPYWPTPRKSPRGTSRPYAVVQGIHLRASCDRYLRPEGEHEVWSTITWMRTEFTAPARRYASLNGSAGATGC